MFRSILIANRGEIACRIIQTARRLGIRTVAVYSEADAAALHVALADDAFLIGPPPARESYLAIDKIIAAARATGAEAIHPGYGFLSENPDFVEAVEAAGLVFVGPPAAAIRAMGLKDAAKRLMQEAGVPVVPGYHGANQDAEHLAGAAEAIGYPVLIKAVAGGGGKGMRRVDDPRDFAEALAAARREAASAFGNDAVLIEKYVEKPRHIEVQVFADGRDAIHLFERDCSLQRRHQKVIEEAPAPGMTDEMRAAMGQAAVRAARAIGYKGAGTVEFIVDASEGLRPDRFYFMEMNTRLQVEHPVTEAITGIDLVEWQLRVAAGEPLPLRQEDLRLNGHAIEARLYAEDVPAGFLPATGRITHLAFPEEARVDTGVRAGDTISPFYDPMIAKIIVHAPTRAVALARLRAALAATEIEGLTTNLAFLQALIEHPGFAAGDVDTGLIARDLARLAASFAPTTAEEIAAAAVAAHAPDTGPFSGFALWAPLEQSVTLRLGEREIVARIATLGPGRHRVRLQGAGDDGGTYEVTVAGDVSIVNGRPIAGRLRRSASAVHLHGVRRARFDLPDPLQIASETAPETNVITAPMPGLIKAVLAQPGQRVARGDRLIILEAMKMEHTLTAPRASTVAEVLAAAGTQVDHGAALIRLLE